MSNQKIETLLLHAGQTPDSDTLSRGVPIYLTSSYNFKSTEHAANLFALKEFGNIYTRLMNPTTAVLETRLAALHNAKGAVAVASGMSAIFYSIAAICKAGDNFITGDKLYGGTYTLFNAQLARFGIEPRFVDSSDPENFAKQIDGKTKLIFTESVGNPACNIDDMAAIAKIAADHNIPLMVDNTTTPPPLFNPFEYGADIAIYSLTKMISGHGSVMGGIVVEKGDFNWKATDNFPDITEPDPNYHGVNFWDAFGDHKDAVAPGMAFSLKIRTGLLRDTGAVISPFNSHQVLLGVETLALRAERHSSNGGKVAQFLEKHPKVKWVNYAGLPSHKDHEISKKMFPLGVGAVFGFGLKGGYDSAIELINNVKLASHLANVLDAKTLIIHPASTTHQQLSSDERQKANVPDDMVRISVGIENVDDIIADLDQALSKVS
ncbi:MAG: O-acetylhomoserine aminocarboxypropyltransferase/cysteine synthase family protein [Nitrospinota bacterium]